MDNLGLSSHSDVMNKVVEIVIKLKKPVEVKFPKRAPSLVIPEKKPVFITPDKTTCVKCPCFPKDSPYRKKQKLRSCQRTPLTLYELAANVVDSAPLPGALEWSEGDVVNWLNEVVGLPQYKECILNNHIDGMRLPQLEDPSVLELINIRIYEHIVTIVNEIKKLYSVDFLKFSRSIGAPFRKPLTHCTWYKSRTGPNWGTRKNWTRCDILRWMKILGPAPVYRDHWDAVWYEPPDFPRTLFGKIPPVDGRDKIPLYRSTAEPCDEYLVPRKFRLDKSNPEKVQLIWMEHHTWSTTVLAPDDSIPGRRIRKLRKSLLPKQVSLKGLKGTDLILTRRVMAKPKFMKLK